MKFLVSFTFIYFLLVISSFNYFGVVATRGRKELHIAATFPIKGTGGWQGGEACKTAASMALEDVNAKMDLLPDYNLHLHWRDSECEPGLGAAVMSELLNEQPYKLIFLAGCSKVCSTVAEAAKMWNLVVLCYGASNPALSDRKRFPTLFRTHPSASVHNPTRITLMQKFGWKKVAILQQADEIFNSTVKDLEERCEKDSIEIVTRQSFLTDPNEAIKNLKRQDARVVIGFFYVVAARRVLCEVYKQNLYGRPYVWFFLGWYEDNWFESNLEAEGINCTVDEMRKAAEGHLTTEALMWNQEKNKTTKSGLTTEDFQNRLDAVLKVDSGRYPEGYQEAPLAYDAVWAVALAFNKTMEKLSQMGRKLEDFNYTNKVIADEIYSAMDNTQFIGISGRVAFSSETGDRIALTQVEQLIEGKYVVLGYHDTEMDKLTWYNRERWIGGEVPQDTPNDASYVNSMPKLPLALFLSSFLYFISGFCNFKFS